MLWFLIAIVIAVIVMIVTQFIDHDLGESAGAFCIAAFVAGLIALVINFCMCLGGVAHHNVVSETRNLRVMNDNKGHESAFFLFAGASGDYNYFNYYSERNGIFTLNNIDADYVEIVETTGPPRVETIHQVKNNSHFTVFPYDGWDTYRFFIPEGTIKQNIQLDAK